MPFWPMEKDESGALIVRFDGTEETSIPFYFHKVHNTLLKLANKYGALNVDVQVTEGAVYISLYSYEPGMAPALLINHTDIAIDYYDKARKDSVKVLYPSNKVLFCWESVEEHHTLAWLNGKHTNHLREDGIGDFSNGKDRKYYWVSFLYGLQRVLLFTDVPSIARDAQNIGENEVFTQEIEMSIHGIGLSLVDNISKVEVLYVGITSSGIVWETKKASKKRYKTLSSRDSELIETAYNHYVQKLAVGDRVDPKVTLDNRIVVDFEEQQMLKPSNKQLRRTYNTGLWLHICSSVHQYQLHAKINRIQIDNQMFDCVFPVVLSPVPPPRSISADSTPKPFIEVSIVKRINDYSAVQQYKYFKILIQEFHIKVDIGFINALVKLFEAGEISEEDEKNYFIKDRALVNEPLLSHVTFSSSQEQKNFYDILHLSPLKIHVSFSLSGQQDVAGGGGTPPFLNVLMQSFGVTLTDIQDVILKLSYFERQYSFLTQRQLLSEAQSHYVGQLVKQLYVLVFGLDVLGNPYGLVLGFTQGAADLFYEPFQGAIQGPGEFAEGLVLGVRSLFGHTVGGAAGAVSRITGAMGKGLAALTFDKEYQRHRRETLNKRPANMQEGLARSGKGLVMGVVEGIGGVITKPISGAKDEGVQGFFKGVGKGVVGLVTRPTAGIVDFAAGSFNAVKRATDMSEEVTRMRVPRHFKADGLVRPYSKLEAEGNKLLLDLEKGRFTLTDTYVFHMPMGSAKQKDMLLLTDQRIAYLSHNEIFGGYQMDWSYTWQDMAEPPRVIENGVVLVTSDKKKGVRGFFLQSDTGKVLLIQDAEMRKVKFSMNSNIIIAIIFLRIHSPQPIYFLYIQSM
ncbi:hypothetical protein AAG570_000294 [Ranatra chinensis]|uniref:Intermembrane lipid transfer protein VPS13-like C-terminal domain-containing protein n=1 Tax=Ranatra chinensis TaxID=642074 RepID=A0ABD0Z9B7_9HEMI